MANGKDKDPSMTRTPHNSSWFKNVAKSLGYSSTDLISSITPTTGEFIRDNGSFIAGSVSNIRNSGSGNLKGMLSDAIRNNKTIAVGKTAMKNAVEDLRSGKIYNKERADQVMNEVIGGDEDFGLDDFDFGDNNDHPDDIGTTEDRVHKTDKSDAPDSSSTDNKTSIAVAKSAKLATDAIDHQTRVTANVGNNIVNSQRNNAQAIIASNRTLASPITSTLNSIDSNIAKLVTFQGESMSKYIGSSITYYDQNVKAFEKATDMLSKLYDNSVKAVSEREVRQREHDYDKVFGGGAFSAQGYANVVKSNIKRYSDENFILSNLKMMLSSTDDLKIAAANPLGFIATKAVEKVIPQFLQASLKQFDQSFKEFVPAALMRLGREKDKNGVSQLLFDIFGIRSSTKKTVNLGNFERGPIPFDGETKKAITEVIPGYLRKMLGALTGQKEMSFDYVQGKWRTVQDIKETFNKERDSKMMGSMDDIKKYIGSMVQKNYVLDDRSSKDLDKGINSFLKKLVESGYGVNVENRQQLLESLKPNFNISGLEEAVANAISALQPFEKYKMMGSAINEGRIAENRYMEEAEKNMVSSNASTVFNGLDDNSANFDSQGHLKSGKGVLGGVDKFGMSTLDYTRDIRSILLNGIKVYPMAKLGGSGSFGPDFDPNEEMVNQFKLKKELIASREYKNNTEKYREMSDSELQDEIRKGKILLSSDGSSREAMINNMRLSHLKEKESENGQEKDGSVVKWLGKLFSSGKNDRSQLIREKVEDILATPARMVDAVFKRIDKTMYNIVFPGGDKDKPSLFSAIANKFKSGINSMEGFVKNKIFIPIKEGFVGEKGLINQIKESGLFDSGKNQMKKMTDYLFGEKRLFDDGSTKRTGGFLGEFGDNILDVGSAIKYQFTGKGYKNRAGETFGDSKEAFMPSMKNMFTGMKSSVTKYLMGDKDAEREADKRGILTTVFNTVQTGANNWREAIFGPSEKKKRDKSLKETLEVVKKKAPKAAALGVAGGLAGGLLASGSGLLGAVLLPGAMGPILGMGLGMATQSESFMTRMFGDKDVDGKRIGGFISRNTQDFFKKNKNVIIGGGLLGLMKPMLGFGILPSFFLPGGPVGAAALGVAGAMAYRSNAVQNILFGKIDEETGVRMGGLFSKAANGMKVKGKKFKDLIPNVLAGGTAGAGLAAVIGQFGLLGAMLTPLGPIGGALMGAAGGIALSSEKFKNALFGKWDDETGAREGGVLGKFSNWFNMEVKSPLNTELRQIKLNMKKWFTTSIANPFKDAIAPMKKAFSNMTESLQRFFVDGWNSFKDKIGETFEKNIGKPFGEFMNKHIMTPMKKIMRGMVYGPAKIFGAIASAPFKGLGFVGNRLEKGQMRKGIKDYRKQISENGEMNFFQKTYAKYFDRNAIKEAQFSEAGADYYKEEQERKSKRNAEQSAAWASEQALIDADKNKLSRGQALAAKHGYEGVIEVPDGKGGTRKINLEQFYNLSTKSRSMRHFMENNKDGASLYNRNFEDLLGVSLQQLMNSGDNVTVNSLSRAQRKRLSKAIQSGKKGNALLRHFGINPKAETTAVADAEIATEATPAAVVNETKQTTEAVKTGTDSIVQATRESSSKRAEQLNTLGTKIVEAVKEALPASRPRTIKASYKNPKGGSTNAVTTTETGEVLFMGESSSPSAVLTGGSMNSNVSSASQPSMYDLIFRISQDVRSISMDTKGQLDGVGSNVFKLRKTVQMFLNVDDSDITGSNNKDRMGLWGRFRRAIFKPFEQIQMKIQSIGQLIKDKVSNVINTVIVKPIKKVQDIMHNTFNQLRKGMNAIIDAGVSAGKVIAGAAKFIVVDIPKTIISTVKTAAEGIAKGIGKVFTGIMDSTGAIIAGIGEMGKSIISGIGKLFVGATEIVKGFGTMIGNVFIGVGKMVKGTLKGIGNFAKGIAETIIPTAKLVKEKVTKGLVTLAEMPFKIAAGVRNGISAAVDITKDLVSSTAKFISEKYTAMMDGLAKVGEVAKKALNGVVDVTKKIGIGIWNVIKKPFSLIGQGINAVRGTQKPKEVIIKGGYLEGIKHTIKVTKGDADDADFALLSSTIGDVDPAKGIKDKQSKRMINLFRSVWTKANPLPVIVVDSKAKKSSDSDGGGNGGGGGMMGGSSMGDAASLSPTEAARLARAGAQGAGKTYRGFKGAKQSMGGATGFRGKIGAGFSGFKSGFTGNKGKVGVGRIPTGSSLSVPSALVSGMNINTDFNAGGFRRNDPSVYGTTGQADYASRRNVSHYLGEMAEKQEIIQRASFRFANVDFLSKIEYNTRRTYQLLEELAGELPGLLDKLGRKLLKGLHDIADAVNRIPEEKPEDETPPEDSYPGDGGGSSGGGTSVLGRGGGNRNPYRNLTNPGYYGNGKGNVIVNVDCCACGGKNTGGSNAPIVSTGNESSAAASAAGQQAGPIIITNRRNAKGKELPNAGVAGVDDRHPSQHGEGSGFSVIPGGKGKGQRIEVIPGKGGEVVQFPTKEVPTAKPAKTGSVAALVNNGFMSNLGFALPLLGDTGKPSKGRPGRGILGGITRGVHGVGSTAADLLIGYGISRYLFPSMDDGFANFDFGKGMEGVGKALKDGGSSVAKFFGWDKSAEDKKHSKDYTAFKDSNLYNWMTDTKDTVGDTFKGMYDSVKNSSFVQNTILPFVTNIGKGLKDIVSNTGDDLIQGWEDLKDMDWDSLFSNDTLQKLAMVGTGVGLLAGRRIMKNRKYRRDMQNKDEAADAARRNGRGYLTELHIKNRAKRRTFGQTMKDSLFTNSVFTKKGRARGKELKQYRKLSRTKAKQDLKDYYNDMNGGRSLDKYDKYYAEDMMFDRNGDIRPEFLTQYDNGKVVVSKPGEVGDDYNRSHGAYYNGTRVNGEYTTRAYDARYETEPNKFRRFWNKYGSSEKRAAYHEYKEQQKQFDQHEFDSSGGRLGINKRPGFISKAGSLGGSMIRNTLGGMIFGMDPITYAMSKRAMKNLPGSIKEFKNRKKPSTADMYETVSQEELRSKIAHNEEMRARIARQNKEGYDAVTFNGRNIADYHTYLETGQIPDSSVRRVNPYNDNPWTYNPYDVNMPRKPITYYENEHNSNVLELNNREVKRHQQGGTPVNNGANVYDFSQARRSGSSRKSNGGGSNTLGFANGLDFGYDNGHTYDESKRYIPQAQTTRSRVGRSRGRAGAVKSLFGAVGKAGKSFAGIAGKAGKFMGSSVGRKTLRIGGLLGKNALKVGGALAGGVGLAAGAAMGYADGRSRTSEIFGLKEGQKATAKQKNAAGIAGGIVGTIPFADMLDEALGGKITKYIAKIAVDTDKAWGNAKKAVSSGWKSVKEAVSGKVKEIAKDTKSVFKKIGTAVSKPFKAMYSGIKSAVKSVSNSTKKIFNNIKKSVSTNFNKAKSAVTSSAKKVYSVIKSIFSKIKSAVSSNFNKAKSVVTKIAKNVYTTVKDKFNAVKEKISDAFSKVKTTVTDKAAKIITTVKDKFQSAVDAVKNKFTSLKSTLAEKAQSIMDAIINPIRDAASTISSKLSGIKSSVSSFLDKINPFGNGEGRRTSSYGRGGKVTQTSNRSTSYGAGDLESDGAYYSQNDARWSGQSLTGQSGSASVGEAGCGPTAASMLVDSIQSEGLPPSVQTGQGMGTTPPPSYGAGKGGSKQTKSTASYGSGAVNVKPKQTPIDALKYAQKGGFVDGSKGTRSDFFQYYGAANGIAMSERPNPTSNELKDSLARGNKVILRGEGGRNYTNAGHYIVATGLTSDGKVKIKDPISRSRSGSFSADEVTSHATSAFIAHAGLSKPVGDKPTYEDPMGGLGFGLGDKDYGGGGTVSGMTMYREGLKYLGTPYVFGGNSLSGGIDCSGFIVQLVKKLTGKNIVRTAQAQYQYTKRVSYKDVRVGDLVFFSGTYKRGISHVAVVGPNGYIVQAAGTKVNRAHLGDTYWRKRISGYGRLSGIVKPGALSPVPTPYVSVNAPYMGSASNAPDRYKLKSAKAYNASAAKKGDTTKVSSKNKSNKLKSTLKTIRTLAITDPFEQMRTMMGSAAAMLFMKNSKKTDLTKLLYDITTQRISVPDSGGNSSNSKTSSPAKIKLKGKLRGYETAIKQKITELVGKNEGGGYFYAAKSGITSRSRNDSPDMGIFHWRESTAADVSRGIYNANKKNPYGREFSKTSAWTGGAWSSAKVARFKKFLNYDKNATKKVQNQKASARVEGYMQQVAKGAPGITDPKQFAVLGEWLNTGNHASSMRGFRSGSLGKFRNHFLNHSTWFTSPSLYQYRTGYRNRLNNDVKNVSKWKPSYAKGKGKGSYGAGNINSKVLSSIPSAYRNSSLGNLPHNSLANINYGKGIVKKASVPTFAMGGKYAITRSNIIPPVPVGQRIVSTRQTPAGMVQVRATGTPDVSYIFGAGDTPQVNKEQKVPTVNSNNNVTNVNNITEQLSNSGLSLEEIITLLQQIADNTRDTAENIKEIIIPDGNGGTSIIPVRTSSSNNLLNSKSQTNAINIAKGRK